MAYTDHTIPEPEKEAPPPGSTALPPPPGNAPSRPPPPPRDYFRVVDVVLRLLLFSAALVAVVVMVTSNQTKPAALISYPPYVLYNTAKFKNSPAFMRWLFSAVLVAVVVMVTSNQTKPVALIPFPPYVKYNTAKFKDSPAFIYYVAALSVAGLYAIITTVLSFLALLKPRCPRSAKVLPHFVIFDVLLLGIVASATGTAGGVAYIGMKGNSHTRWTKICNVFEKFCHRVEASIAVSIFASIVLALLIILSAHSLSKRIPR